MGIQHWYFFSFLMKDLVHFCRMHINISMYNPYSVLLLLVWWTASLSSTRHFLFTQYPNFFPADDINEIRCHTHRQENWWPKWQVSIACMMWQHERVILLFRRLKLIMSHFVVFLMLTMIQYLPNFEMDLHF